MNVLYGSFFFSFCIKLLPSLPLINTSSSLQASHTHTTPTPTLPQRPQAEPLVTNKSEGDISLECDVMQVSSDSEDSCDDPTNLPLPTLPCKMSTEDVAEKLDGMENLKLASPPHPLRSKLPHSDQKQNEKPVDGKESSMCGQGKADGIGKNVIKYEKIFYSLGIERKETSHLYATPCTPSPSQLHHQRKGVWRAISSSTRTALTGTTTPPSPSLLVSIVLCA